jgi:hypothetical protein
VRELKQRGVPGFRITRWRVLRDGAFSVREHRTDYYPPTAQLWRVGKGPEDPRFEGHDDDHPEYVADEFLTMREGTEIVESRVPGKSGPYGWTEREGLAKQTQGTRTKRAGRTGASAGSGATDADRQGID